MSRSRVALVAALLALTPLVVSAQGGGGGGGGSRGPTAHDVVFGFDDDPAPGSQFVPTPGADRMVTFRLWGSDPDGADKIEKFEITIYPPSANGCSQGPGEPPGRFLEALKGDPRISLSGIHGNATFTIRLDYNQTAGTYHVKGEVSDKQGARSETCRTFEVSTAVGFTVSATSIAFEALRPGHASAVRTLTITNTGNQPLDVILSGEDLVSPAGAVVPVGSVRVALASDMSGSFALSTDGVTLTNVLPGVRDAQATLHFRLTIPNGTAAGSYSSLLTLVALASE